MLKQIPKIIHYFWFGGQPLPPKVVECLQSWKIHCPDYRILRWDETNFNIKKAPRYVQEAYRVKKWAFVSDYARLFVLNKYGGIYFDTDVKLIKSIDNIVKTGPFFAREDSQASSVNPGIGMATFANNPLLIRLMSEYNKERFILSNGILNNKTIVQRLSKILIKDGLKSKNVVQKIDGFNIYPYDYFCPLSFTTGKCNITKNTVAIHLYLGSWLTDKDRKNVLFERKLVNLFGKQIGLFIFKIYIKPYNFHKKLKKIGLQKTITFYIIKYLKKK